MELFVYSLVYIVIFIIGTLFGSFFTLAVYRIPMKENILYKHSFCPNCEAKLKFRDLIPIISYISLGGKCRYCGQKIRIRYLVLEVLSGIVFVLFALSFNVNLFTLSIKEIIYFCLLILYIASLFIIAGIDKENIKIEKSVLVFGFVISLVYMIYVCIYGDSTLIYTYIIYLLLTIVLLICDTVFLRIRLYQNYTIQVLMLCLYILVFSDIYLFYFTVVFTLLWIAIERILINIKRRIKKSDMGKLWQREKLPLGFYLCVSNIILLISFNFLCNWVI